jgi:hypothetical protein
MVLSFVEYPWPLSSDRTTHTAYYWNFFLLHYTYISPLSLSRLWKQIMPILLMLCYNGSVVTWTAVSLTTSKFKPLIFPYSPVHSSLVQQIAWGTSQHSLSWLLSRLLRVLKWGLLFDEWRGLTTYWLLLLCWGVTLLALTLSSLSNDSTEILVLVI